MLGTPNRRIKLAYILAASHSGSTLLARVMSANSSICSVGELKLSAMGDVSSYRCSCGSPIQECEFWCSVQNKMNTMGIPFSLSDPGTDVRDIQSDFARRLLRPMHKGPLLEHMRELALGVSSRWRRHLKSVQLRNAALARVLLDQTRSDVIMDSSKVGLRLKYLLRNPELDVYVIRLIRDGRAVALTYYAPDEYADALDSSLRRGGRGNKGAASTLDIDSAAKEWCLANAEAEAICRNIPANRLITLSYERLCEDPESIARSVAVFLGADSAPGFSGAKIPDMESHIVGNGMRFDREIDVVLDERWKEAYSPDQLARIRRIVSSMNRKYGYS